MRHSRTGRVTLSVSTAQWVRADGGTGLTAATASVTAAATHHVADVEVASGMTVIDA